MPKRARKTHWVEGGASGPFCGDHTRGAQITETQAAVTCGRCRRLLGLAPYQPALPTKYRTLRKPGTKAIDSLMRRAVGDYEAGLRVRVDALKLAMQGWEAADRDDLASAGEGLRTEAQALVDWLEGTDRNN